MQVAMDVEAHASSLCSAVTRRLAATTADADEAITDQDLLEEPAPSAASSESAFAGLEDQMP
jgi:hypothetical protein